MFKGISKWYKYIFVVVAASTVMGCSGIKLNLDPDDVKVGLASDAFFAACTEAVIAKPEIEDKIAATVGIVKEGLKTNPDYKLIVDEFGKLVKELDNRRVAYLTRALTRLDSVVKSEGLENDLEALTIIVDGCAAALAK